jgi:dipeptide transport system substrate-binding protein
VKGRSGGLPGAALALCLGGAQAAGTLSVCSTGSPEGFDIAQYETIVTAVANNGIYDQLLAFKPGSTELVPALATKWDISADGLSYTFTLRRGVKFHSTPWFKPTRDFNADDVVWSVNRLNDKTHPAHGAAKAGYVYWTGMDMPALLKSVSKVDDFTVRFTLQRPDAPFLADMAMSALGSVFSAEYGARLVKAGRLDALNTQPVGTGPFALKSYEKDAVVRYVAHAAHWGGAPQVDNLIFAITPDAAVRAQRLRAGECQIALSMKADLVAGLQSDPKLVVVTSNPLEVDYIAINTQHPPLNDRRLREALWLAYDGKSMVQAGYAGRAKLNASYLPSALWSHDATLQRTPDLERARQLVKASGYDGRELSLFIRVGGALDGKRIGELLQADWARIGVKVKVQLMELGELSKRSAKGDHDLMLWGWTGDNGDPDNFFTPNLACTAVAGGGNKSRWCHPPFEALIDSARRSTDLKQRTELYRKVQRMVFDEVPAISLVESVTDNVLSKRVQGFVPSPLGVADFRNVSLK